MSVNLEPAILVENGKVYGGAASLSYVVTGVLTAGSTTLTFSNVPITSNSMIDIYTNVYGLNPTNVVVDNNSMTLTFEAQQTDVSVKVKVS